MATNETGGAEEIPMTGDGDDTTDETGDQETNIDDDLWEDDVFTRVDESETLYGSAFQDALFRSSDEVRDDLTGTTIWKKRRLAALKLTEIKLNKVFERDFRGSFGPANRELLKSLRVTDSGLEFTNLDVTPKAGKDRSYVTVIVGGNQGQGLRLATSKDPTRLAKFNKLVERAKVESENKSADAEIRRTAGKESVNEGASTSDAAPITREVVDEVLEGTGNSLEDELLNRSINLEESLKKLIRSGDIGVNDQIVREIAAVSELQLLTKVIPLDEKFILYDANIKYWKELSVREGTKASLKELYEKVAELDGLARDFVRVRARMKPEMEIAREILKEKIDGSDMLRLERFKRWAKKNMVGLSTGAITIAAFVTSVVMAARAALRVGAQGVGRFAKAVGNILKKMGPIFSALGTVISTALSWGAKGVAWLASNLWILAIAIAYALYNGYISRRNTPTPQIQQTSTRPRRVRNRVENYA